MPLNHLHITYPTLTGDCKDEGTSFSLSSLNITFVTHQAEIPFQRSPR